MKSWRTLVVGFGSPFGDDRAGWQLAEMLQRRRLQARVIAVRDATHILASLHRCEHLIAVDACRSGARLGEITHLRWPDPQIAVRHCRTTHGLGLFDALTLAERLGDLPQDVEIYGIEIANWSQGHEISDEVLQSISELELRLFREIRNAADQRVQPCARIGNDGGR
jgi:hydrogenase maturation protease